MPSLRPSRLSSRISGATSITMLLTACTTVSGGFFQSAPGENPHSFRECLVENGFFTDNALIGGAATNFVSRHATDKINDKPDILTASDAEFVLKSANAIRGGLLPAQQFADSNLLIRPPMMGYVDSISDPAHNRPEINLLASNGEYRNLAPNEIPRATSPARLNIPVNRYLDCYLGPVGRDESGASTTGDFDREGRLLRAHILLTMLAAYGTELVSSVPSKRQAEQATRLLGHLRDAELALRSSSFVMDQALLTQALTTDNKITLIPAYDKAALAAVIKASESDGIDKATEAAAREHYFSKLETGATTLSIPADRAGKLPGLRWYDYTTRLLRVFQIGVDVEVIDGQQSLDRVTNIIAAFSAKSPTAFDAILKDALKGLGTVQKVELYGAAMRRDASETLATHRLSLKATPAAATAMDVESFQYDVKGERLLWGLWDAKLERSCKLLSTIAKQTESGCLPKVDSMKEVIQAELPLDESSAS